MSQECGIKFRLLLLHPKFWLTWFGISIYFFISLFPVSIRHFLGRKVGKFTFERNKKRRHYVETNLKIAFPKYPPDEIRTMALRHLEWYGCALIDYSLIFFSSKSRLNRSVSIIGKENIDEAVKNDRTIILLVVHSVMLEFCLPQIGNDYDFFGSYKTSKNPVLDWLVARSRCKYASFLVSRDQGLRKVVKSMSAKYLFMFAPDEDLGEKNAVFAPFFGKEKATLSTTARLTRMAKAVAIPTFVYFDVNKKKYVTHIGQKLDDYPSDNALNDAINMNKAIEALILEQPEQYMWFMKIFSTRPNDEESLY